MRFVETQVFTTQIVAAIEDDSYRRLQFALLLRPEQGSVIRGSGGLRKLRWAVAGYVYPKNVQVDLSPAQTRILKRLVEEEFK